MFLKWLLPWVLLLFAGATVLGQQYPFLPVSGSPKAVKKLFQDSQGRLWLVGLNPSFFDGSRFFFLRDYGFPSIVSYDVAEDSSGAIWIGAETGVFRFSNGTVNQVSDAGAASSVIAVTPTLVLAAVGPPGPATPVQTVLFRIERTAKAWHSQRIMNLDSPGPLTLDRHGALLYPWPGQGWNEILLADVLRWQAGAKISVSPHPVAGAPATISMKVLRDRSGCVWLGGPGTNIYDCGGGGHALAFEGVRLLPFFHETPDGNMLLTGQSLLALGRPGSFQVATPANGLPAFGDALPAKDGTIWLAGPDGLFRFPSPFRLEYWTVREGLRNAPWSLARSGARIFAGLDQRIEVLGPARDRWEPVAAFQNGGIVSGLLGKKDGTLLAALRDGGVVQLETSGRILARTPKAQMASIGMRLLELPNGEVWLGGSQLGRLSRRGGVLNLDVQPLRTQPARNVLAVKYEEHTRKLWTCYNGGVAIRNEDGSWKELTIRDGLLVNGCWSLAPLPNGDAWDAYFSALDIALIRPAANGRFTVRQYGRKEGVPDPGGNTMDADQRGRLWRAADIGTYVAEPPEAEAGKWLTLDRSDGFPANGMNSGSFLADPDGSLWWGADLDLVHYRPPADLTAPRFSPQVFISAFSLNDGEAPRLAEAAAGLPHGFKVKAYIGSLQFDRRNDLQVRYRLLPEQPAWRETKDLEIPLGALSAGSHTLEVQGRIFTGPWSSTVSRAVTVLLPTWLTGPFVLGYIAAIGLLASAAYWRQQRHKTDAAALLPELAAWRAGVLLPELRALTGTSLDQRFDIGALLARGGFATVFTGYDQAQQCRCAIKIFRNEVKNNAWVMRGFKQEVAALRRISHPNVVPIYADGVTAQGAPYLVMEFVEGRSLREVLEGGRLSSSRIAGMLRQLAGALDAIHRLGICHRDVKPENLIVRDESSAAEEIILIDFSIAIVKDASETLQGLSRAAGTFEYMAPEQAVGHAEPASDVYSFAKLIVEMLTGSRVSALFSDAALQLPARVRDMARTWDAKLSTESVQLLSSALEFDPAKRPNVAGLFVSPIARDLELAE